LDREKEQFHLLVAKGYEQMKELFKDRYYIVDADRQVADIVYDAVNIIKSKVV